MAYRSSNAAVAYDAQPFGFEPAARPQAPEPARRPRLDVVSGAGREANQAVSPLFTHVIKVACALAIVFCLVGVVRVALAGMTSSTMNSASEVSSQLESTQEQASDLEVMRSVYSSETRVRDLASSSLGMEDATGGVTIDLSQSSN